MAENNMSIRNELIPFSNFLTDLINQNKQLTNEVEQIRIQIEKQNQDSNQQVQIIKQNFQLEIDQINLKLNQQIQINENLQNEIDQLKQNNDQISQLNTNIQNQDTDFKKYSKQFDNNIQAVELRLNYLEQLLLRPQLKKNIKWEQRAKTVAGGNGEGDKVNQLNKPLGIYVDHQQQSIYIADQSNHRIVKWKLSENNGQIVAGGNGQGNRIDQLSWPTDVIVDESNKSLIICDKGNRRVVRWSLENQKDKQIIIENINCWGLTMNENGDLFVSDQEKNEVKRWRKGEKGEGTIVAGGNGKGNQLNQLNYPRFLVVDREETVYVSDRDNHRVMKWLKGAKEGIVVAGGQGQGDTLKQLFGPMGLIVNETGDVYVVDSWNHRIMCWSSECEEGRVVVGGNERGKGSNQLNYPYGLSFDIENNFYVSDWANNRIQRFEIDKN